MDISERRDLQNCTKEPLELYTVHGRSVKNLLDFKWALKAEVAVGSPDLLHVGASSYDPAASYACSTIVAKNQVLIQLVPIFGEACSVFKLLHAVILIVLDKTQ